MARRKASRHRCISAEAGISRAAKHSRDMGSRTKLGIGIGILALGLCVAGCTAPQSDVEKPTKVKEGTGGVRTLTLAFEAPTRAGLAGDGVTPLWEVGDEILLWGVEDSPETVRLKAEDIEETEGGANCARISTSLEGTVYAVYPAEAVSDFNGWLGSVTLKIPSLTNGSFEQAHIAVSKSEGDKMFFRNAVSILEFKEVGERVKSIEMSYSGRCSTYDVTIGDKLDFSNYNSTGSEMIKVTGMTAGERVYLPVVPGAKIPAEAVFTFRDAKGSVLRRMTHSSALTPEVSWIYELGAAGPATVPAGAVSGAFSVSDSRQIFFAEANLQSPEVFASGQTAFGGLFTEAEEFCIWRPLTAEELNYLFSGRTSAAGTAPTIAGTANAIYLKCTVGSVCGLLLFPDAFEWPSSIKDSKADCANDWEADFSSATFDSDEFATLEAAGCVFLPAAGFSSGGSMYNAGSQGYYLTSTDVVLSFHADGLSYTGENKDPNIAQSLRLVTDAF